MCNKKIRRTLTGLASGVGLPFVVAFAAVFFITILVQIISISAYVWGLSDFMFFPLNENWFSIVQAAGFTATCTAVIAGPSMAIAGWTQK